MTLFRCQCHIDFRFYVSTSQLSTVLSVDTLIYTSLCRAIAPITTTGFCIQVPDNGRSLGVSKISDSDQCFSINELVIYDIILSALSFYIAPRNTLWRYISLIVAMRPRSTCSIHGCRRKAYSTSLDILCDHIFWKSNIDFWFNTF